jgi:acetylglutamate kinase
MDKLHVIKIGGNIIDDEPRLHEFLKAFAMVPGKKILVHGGGKLATKMAEQMGISQQLIEGRRITDEDTLRIVTMVYAGFINKNIVATLQSLGCNALGLTGADGNAIAAHKRQHATIDYGFVGDVDSINADLLKSLLDIDLSLVFAPITHTGASQLLNTNADTIAQELAKGLSKYFEVSLIYSFEKAGVLRDADDDTSVIPIINSAQYNELKGKNIIFAGMIPKMDNAFSAITHGVWKVIIGKAEELDQLIAGTAGTTIMND